jgi:hypothetical protein
MDGIVLLLVLLRKWCPKAVYNARLILEPNPKMGLQHIIYSLQQSTHTEDVFWVSEEA